MAARLPAGGIGPRVASVRREAEKREIGRNRDRPQPLGLFAYDFLLPTKGGRELVPLARSIGRS
jgi:hypothetical protein